MPTPTIEVDGLFETLNAIKGLQGDLRKEANAELRVAGRRAAEVLAADLRTSAARSGVPVAPRVAAAIRTKSDRVPTVIIGGNRKVGRRGASAAVLAWGSEHGPAGAPNHFGVAPNAGGYWIAPAVRSFEGGPALTIYKRAVFETIKRYGLI